MPPTLLLKNATLIDGTGRPPRQNVAVSVQDGKIAHVGDDAGWAAQAEEQVITLDLTGKYLLPGLIDTHVHLAGSGEPDSRIEGDDGTVTLKILQNAQKNLAAGITTVRDLGGWNELEFAVRRAIQRGDFSGPRLMLAGRFISITESGAEYYPGMYRVADGVDEVRKAVREQVKNGADLIKIGVTGAVLVEDGIPGATHYNEDEIRAAVEEAAKFGKSVAAHAHGIDGIRKAVEAGVRTIEHGTFLHRDKRVAEMMAERDVFLVPTLKAGWDLMGENLPGVPKWIIEKSHRLQEDAVKSLRLAYAMGVPIAMGSDAATPLSYHGENVLEIHWMAEAGLPPMQAIVAATLDAARALGWDSWLGSVEVGKAADMIVVAKNPLDDLKTLADKRNHEMVIKNGKVAARRLDLAVPQSAMVATWTRCGIAS